MIKVCEHSCLILSANVAVLLVVAVTTSYWEYRGIRLGALASHLTKLKVSGLTIPYDTNTYMELYLNLTGPKDELLPPNMSHYQPPVFMKTSETRLRKTTSKFSVQTVRLVLFSQYGNLYRDCDLLEDFVRAKVGLKDIQPQRCLNFITKDFNSAMIHNAADQIALGRAALGFASVAMAFMMAALVFGSLGSMSPRHNLIIAASIFALFTGLSLTVSIALFNGRSYLSRKQELLHEYDVPHKDLLNSHRTHSYGWSFVLAWLCVALTFVSSAAWLYRAQVCLVEEGSNNRVEDSLVQDFEEDVDSDIL